MTTRRFIATVGTPIALAAILAGLQHPALFLWYLGVAAVLGGLGGYCSAWIQGGRVVELERALGEREDDVADLEAEAQRLHLLLTEAQIAAGDAKPLPRLRVVDRPDLRVIPPPRTRDHLADDDAWFTRLYDENGEHRG